MPHMIVTVNKLNRRSSPVANVADKSNIIDIVNKGFTFESTEQINNAAGSWYKDNLNLYYWAGGLTAEIVTQPVPVNQGQIIAPTSGDIILKPPAIIPHDMPLSKQNCIKCATWMKENFEDKVNIAVEHTPFTNELIYSIACQETAQRWQIWIGIADAATLLEQCVFDASGDFPDTTRNVFPKNRDEFTARYGNEFSQMLVDEGNKMRAMPQPGFPHGYGPSAYLYKGYGIFQYDLQNVTNDRNFFADKQWYSIDECLKRIIQELKEKWERHPNDMYNTVKAYNGAGERAEQYAQKVSQFYTWIKAT